MQNAERERLIRQMAATPVHRAAVIAKSVVCVGVLGVLIAVGRGSPDHASSGSAAPASRVVATSPRDVGAEAHRKHVFDARRQDATEFARDAQDVAREARMAYVAP